MSAVDLKLISIYSFLDIFKNIDIFAKAKLTFKRIENFIENKCPPKSITIEVERELYILLNKFSHYKKFFTRILKFCRFVGIQLKKKEINNGFHKWDSSLKLEVILSLLEHQLMVKKKLRNHILAGSEDGKEKVRSQPLAHLEGQSYYAFKDMSGDVRVVKWSIDEQVEKCSILSRDKQTLKVLIECLKDSKALKSVSNEFENIETNKKVLIESLEKILIESKENEEFSNFNKSNNNHASVMTNYQPKLDRYLPYNKYTHPSTNHQFLHPNKSSLCNDQSLYTEITTLPSDFEKSNPLLTPTKTAFSKPILHPESLFYLCPSPSSDEPDSDKGDPAFTLGPNDIETDDEEIAECDEDANKQLAPVPFIPLNKNKIQPKKSKSKQKGLETRTKGGKVTAKEMQKQIKNGIMSYFKHQKATYTNKKTNVNNINNIKKVDDGYRLKTAPIKRTNTMMSRRQEEYNCSTQADRNNRGLVREERMKKTIKNGNNIDTISTVKNVYRIEDDYMESYHSTFTNGLKDNYGDENGECDYEGNDDYGEGVYEENGDYGDEDYEGNGDYDSVYGEGDYDEGVYGEDCDNGVYEEDCDNGVYEEDCDNGVYEGDCDNGVYEGEDYEWDCDEVHYEADCEGYYEGVYDKYEEEGDKDSNVHVTDHTDDDCFVVELVE